MHDYDLLQRLSDNGGSMPWSELLNSSGDINTANGYLQALKEKGYISGSLRAHSSVRITPSGRAYLQDQAEVQKERNERERYIKSENRRSNVIAIVGTVFGGIAAVIAVLEILSGLSC